MIAVALILYIWGAAVMSLLLVSVNPNCSPLRFISIVTFWPFVAMYSYTRAICDYAKYKWDNRK